MALLHSIPALPNRYSPATQLKSQNCPSPSLSVSIAILPKTQKSLSIEISQLSLLSILPSCPRRISAYSSAAYTETDNEFEEQEEEEEEGDELDYEQPRQVSQVRSKVLKKDVGRLYVGNIPFTATSHELAELFGEAGTINNVDVIYDRVTDRSRGFAFVTMSSAEEASEAIRMFDGSQLGGRTIKVNFPEIPRGGEREVLTTSTRPSRGYIDSPHKIYAGNLGWGLTSEGLKDVFSAQSGLLGAKVIFDRETGRSRGFGFVSFQSAEEAESALESMNGVEVEGRPLRLSPATGRVPAVSPSSETQREMEGSTF